MANDTQITLVGNMVADPELRWTPNGVAVCNFSLASTPRTFDRQRNEWVDGNTLFLRCTIWREAAENVAESLDKGTRVVAQGRLKASSYTDRDGNKRTSWEMDVDDVGPSLKYATAKVTRNQRNNQGGYNQQGGGYPQQGGGYPQQGGGYNAPQGGQQGGQPGGPQGEPQGGQFPQGQDPWNGQGAPSMGEDPF